MRILRRKSHDGRDSSPMSDMKRQNYSNSDDISTSDTAELSGDSPVQIKRCLSLQSSSRDEKAEYSTDEDDGGSSSNYIATPLSNKPMRDEDEKVNVKYLNLKAPAPTEHRAYITREECEEIMREYEDEIVRLNKLNSTLSDNVAALYAENEAVEEELCHQNHLDMSSLGKGQTEMSADETNDNGMTIAEEQYVNEVAKHRKSNNKLKKQLQTQKRLVAKLSLHLKTSADKITALMEEREVWKSRAESLVKDADETANEDQRSDIQKCQIQVVHNELVSLQNLIEHNSQVHRRDRQQLLDEYESEDSVWKFNLEEPIHTMERIIRSLTENNNGGIIDIPVEEHLEVKPVPVRRKEEVDEGMGFNVMDSVTSLFAKKQFERKQAKIKVDEHPMSNEIKSFDVSRLKKNADGAVKECSNGQEDEEGAKEDNLLDDSQFKEAQAEVGDSNTVVSEGPGFREIHQNDDKGDDIPFSGESDIGGLCSENVDSTRSSTERADHVVSEVTATGAGSIPVKKCNTIVIEGDNDDGNNSKSDDEESLYDNVDESYVAKEGKSGSDGKGVDLIDDVKGIEITPDTCQMQSDSVTSDLHHEDGDVVIVLHGEAGSNYIIGDGQPDISSSEFISNAPQSVVVDVDKEENRLLDNRETKKNNLSYGEKEKAATSCANDQNEHKRTSEHEEEDVKSISHYQNVISQYISSEFNDSSLSKNQINTNSLSRKQLFQREDLTCTDLFVDVVDDFFIEDRRVLIESKNGRDSVPPYEPPTIPPETKKEAPHFKRGAKDGYYIYKSSSGNEYFGHWKSGRRHGYGMAKYRDGEIFHGNWRRGRRHGHGVLHLANQDVFDGDWATNQKHGLGVYYWADGEVDISWYDQDKRVESVRWTNDRRLAYYLDLKATKKEPISLNKAARIVKDWEKKAEVFDC